MPLPAALQARLQKRGLVTKVDTRKQSTTTTSGSEEVEEIFAEDYDDPARDEEETVDNIAVHEVMETEGEQNGMLFASEVPSCPNRSNTYHECSDYCKNRYGMKHWNPDSEMMRKRDRMLGKYPLPPDWEEVADPETDRFFYWNTLTDHVSWLAPAHPRAAITISADKLKAVLTSGTTVESDSEDEDMDANASDGSDSSSSSSSDSEEEYPPPSRRDRGGADRAYRDRRGGGSGGGRAEGRAGGGGRSRKEGLDPMDPSAYSDVARGGWSSGLERSGEAKTGVDTTASGPLFQQRPYPSPGAVLRANKAAKPP